MSTCGYLCPKCEGRGFSADGKTCTWCIIETPLIKTSEQDLEDWVKNVHENSCCGDLGRADND